MPAKIKIEPTHLHLRPCLRLAAAGGGPATWMPSRVTCAECAPAARAVAIGGEWSGIAVLALFVFCLFFV